MGARFLLLSGTAEAGLPFKNPIVFIEKLWSIADAGCYSFYVLFLN